MNTECPFDEEIVYEVPPKSIPFSGGEPYFMDFRTKMENLDKYQALRYGYIEKYPEFWRLLEVMEISFQTYRAELYRLSNLSVGFLRSAELDDFERWKEISNQSWNRLVLIHNRVPQEFYAVLLATANKIRNEYFEREPVWDPILSRQTDHASMYEIISGHRHVDITRKQLREYLVPMGLRATIQKNPWKNMKGALRVDGKLTPLEDCVHKMLNQLFVVLCLDDEDEDPEKDAKIVRINPKAFFGAFEEAIHLSILLASSEYTKVLDILQTTKAKIGRLQDKDFEPLAPYYVYLAKTFFLHHRFDKTRPGLQRRHYQLLSQLFQTELGLTQSRVKAQIAGISASKMQRLNEELRRPITERLLGRAF